MRLTPTKVLNFFTAVVLVVLLWTVFRQTNDASTLREYDGTCDLPRAYVDDLHRLVHATHAALDALDLAHFLCYGSLFGQVRRASSLPWERDAEYCVLNEEFSRYDENYLKREFRARGMDIAYDSGEGLYEVRVSKDSSSKSRHGDSPAEVADGAAAAVGDLSQVDPSFAGYVQLVVFAKDKKITSSDGEEMYHRVGWKRRLLPPDCQYSPKLDCFPARLAEAPLPLKLFGRRVVPVPREEFEILKFHFLNNWWREEKPLNC